MTNAKEMPKSSPVNPVAVKGFGKLTAGTNVEEVNLTEPAPALAFAKASLAILLGDFPPFWLMLLPKVAGFQAY